MSDSLFDPSRINPGKNASEKEYMSVGELNTLVRSNLETAIGRVTVKGEVSNLKCPVSGHIYFTLKDAKAQIRAVWFKFKNAGTRDRIEEGKEIIATGTISLYEARGTYQIIVDSVEAKGKGDLQEKFEQLVEKLKKEGLFDKEHKKPLPLLPDTIGVITSKTGAAVKDITNMIWDRFPGAHIVLGPVAVQGDAAAGEISRMIEMFNAWGKADLLIIGRGGGSLEDLWAFNEEEVARAVFASGIPVISAVGHEIDVSISDLVADARALTPTEAGEMAVPDIEQENQKLDIMLERCMQSARSLISTRKAELEMIRHHRVLALPEETLRAQKQKVLDLMTRMKLHAQMLVSLRSESLKGMKDALENLNPLAVLKRGFSYTLDENGKRVSSPEQVTQGALIRTRLADGTIISKVTDKEKENG